MNFAAAVDLLKQTFNSYNEDKAPRLSAALAFYTIFSLTPLLVIITGVAALIFRQNTQEVSQQLVAQISETFNPQLADSIGQMLQNAPTPSLSAGIVTTIIGVATLLFGASNLFASLQDALNTVWGVKPRTDLGFMGVIRARFLSFAMILGVGFLLLVSLLLSAILAAATAFLGVTWAAQVVNFVVSFVVVTLLFALIFKILPDAQVQWHDVWIGAAITSLLFSVGKFALGLYLGRSSVTSAYGAAGSLVLLLLWVSYAAQILFFGAEFTKVYANKYGSKILPEANAEAVTPQARAEQGLQPQPSVAGATASKSAPSQPAVAASNVPVAPKPQAKGDAIMEDIAAVGVGLAAAFFLHHWNASRKIARQQAKAERAARKLNQAASRRQE